MECRFGAEVWGLGIDKQLEHIGDAPGIHFGRNLGGFDAVEEISFKEDEAHMGAIDSECRRAVVVIEGGA